MVKFWNTFSKNIYEDKFGVSEGLEETWGGGAKEKFS
jgi:hypothetical protein